MERNDYLKLAKLTAIRRSALGKRWNADKYPELLVDYDGTAYVPDSYTLSFDGSGNAVHRVTLQDRHAHSIMVAALSDVCAHGGEAQQ